MKENLLPSWLALPLALSEVQRIVWKVSLSPWPLPMSGDRWAAAAAVAAAAASSEL